MARAYPKTTMPGFIRLKVVQQSPDLNPIQNVWDMLEKALCSGPGLPSSLQDFGESLMKQTKKPHIVLLKQCHGTCVL